MPDFARLANELAKNRVVVTCRNEVEIPPRTVQYISAVSCRNQDEELFVPVTNYSCKKVVLGEGQPLYRESVPSRETVKALHVTSSCDGRDPISDEDVKVGPMVSASEKGELCDLLNRHRDCFALKMDKLGCTDVAEMTIIELPGSVPVSQSPYRCSRYELEILRSITDELKECGLIRDSASQYSSPVLLVKKKNGEHRMVIDYRRLNRQTVKDKFPLPVIDDMLDRLSGTPCSLCLTWRTDIFRYHCPRHQGTRQHLQPRTVTLSL